MSRTRRLLAALLLAAGSLLTAATPAQADTQTVQGYLLLHEENGNRGTLVCAIPILTPPGPNGGITGSKLLLPYNRPYGCDNDEARSMTFLNVGPPLRVEVWNDGGCGGFPPRLSDHAVIFLGAYGTWKVSTFEANSLQIRGLPFHQTYYRVNGDLDGKVSCLSWTRLG